MTDTCHLVKRSTTTADRTPALGHAATLRTIVDDLAGAFLERDDAIRTLVVTMLAGQHSLVLGPTGTAKSDIARAIAHRIEGAKYFETLVHKTLDPTSVFGPTDLVALIRGEYRQIFSGYATEADVVFLDEVFKGAGVMLNSTLAFLNERIYHPIFGGKPRECPLLGAITASNELPDGSENLDAVYDRLLVRLEVDYIVDPKNFGRLLQLDTTIFFPSTKIHIDDLRTIIKQEIPRVRLPESVVNQMIQIRTALHKDAHIRASDRRWRASVSVLKASAWLAGRDAIDTTDLLLLQHILWDRPADRDPVLDAILSVVDPKAKRIREHMRGIRDVRATFEASHDLSKAKLGEWAIKEATPKINRTRKDLESYLAAAIADGRPLAAIHRAIAEYNTIVSAIYQRALDVDGPVIEAAR